MKSYFTSKACKHGHIAERKVVNGGCRQCERDYSNKYDKRNPEAKLKRNAKRDHGKYYDPVKARDYYLSNRERISKVAAAYRSQPEIRQKNIEYQRAYKLLPSDPLAHMLSIHAIRNM